MRQDLTFIPGLPCPGVAIFNTTQSRMSDFVVSCLNKLLENSYSPYSKFKVAAIVETTDGKLFNGVNVENASYGLCICAERTAICNAISSGSRDFKAIYIMW